MSKREWLSFEITERVRRRFEAKVDRTPGHGPNGECWVWTGGSRYGADSDHYGAFKISGHAWDVHRVAYVLANGPIPAGKLICHTCDFKRCVRPQHLALGTYQTNRVDAVQRAVVPFRRTRTEPLTDAEIAQLVDEHNRGVSRRQLARKYRLPSTSLMRVLRKFA